MDKAKYVKRVSKGIVGVVVASLAPLTHANSVLPSYEKCLLSQMHHAEGNTTIAEIKRICENEESRRLLTKKIQSKSDSQTNSLSSELTTQTTEPSVEQVEIASTTPSKDSTSETGIAEESTEQTDLALITEKEAAVEVGIIESDDDIELGAISSRIIHERMTAFDPFVITPHLMNYILPAYTTNRINTQAYDSEPDWVDHMEEIEAKFQLSLKVPLNTQSLLVNGDAVYFGFTVEAWWQVYADDISKPFRETNYRPEMFYLMPLEFHPFGGNSGLMIGAEHQSNGRSQDLSRSWNRIYVAYLYEKGDFALSLRPWYRVSEKEKTSPTDSKGDDNPDILDYMGHFQLSMAYNWDEYNLSLMTRHNFATNKGAYELGLTFPLWGKLRGYTRVFNGYGESLIDYNHKQTRFGIGIALTDIL